MKGRGCEEVRCEGGRRGGGGEGGKDGFPVVSCSGTVREETDEAPGHALHTSL